MQHGVPLSDELCAGRSDEGIFKGQRPVLTWGISDYAVGLGAVQDSGSPGSA
jgi:hypothetical protein